MVASGDISNCTPDACVAAETAGLVADLDPDVMLLLGDLQYPDGGLDDFEAEYDRTWGQLSADSRPVPGNHEYGTPDATGYFDYFGAAASPDTDGYYSFDAQAWHLVGLNSNDECTVIACTDGSAQQEWFAADLAQTGRRCVLAYWHHPRWSTGQHGDTEAVDALWRTAVAGGVDVVLSGHDHDYERFVRLDADGEADAAGTAAFVVGSGGAELRPFSEPQPDESAARVEQTYGVLDLELGRDSYSWEFVGVDGDVLDRGGPVPCD